MDAYIGVKLIHISAIALWSAGLLYLPGLFAEHARADGDEAFRRLRLRTRMVYVALMSPAAVVAIASGTVLVFLAASLGGWLVLKLWAVAAMVMLHVYFGGITAALHAQPQMRKPATHMLLLVPASLLIVVVVYLVTGKPV
jgi:protoporphyrinogen IX oxidase